MKALYGIIKIKVKAEEEEISKNELALSDKLWEIKEKIENIFAEYDEFQVKIQDE